MQCNTTVSERRCITFERGSYIKISGLNFKDREHFKQRLTIPNPAYELQRRFAGWVGSKIPRTLRGYVEMGADLFVAPGGAQMIWRELRHNGEWIEWVDRDWAPYTLGLEYSGEEREYQRAALEATSRRSSGVIVAPCGAGKTDIGCRIIANHQAPALVIVHTRELLKQWVDRLKLRLGVTAGVAGGGKRTTDLQAPVVVATVQTLLSRPGLLKDLHDRMLLIVDECHHTPCSTFTEVIRCLDPRYRYGFTATPDRADGTTQLMYWWIGERIATVERDELEANGHILRPKLVTHPLCSVTYAFNADDPGDYLRVMGSLLEDGKRLAEIVDTVATNAVARGYHLVLTGSVIYGERLLEALKDIVPTAFIHGKLPKTTRAQILEDARAGRTRILIATTLADEGLDLPIFDQVHLVTPTRSASKATQRAGRVCRPFPGKEQPIIHDYVDVNVTAGGGGRLFINQFRNRFRAFRTFADYSVDAVKAIFQYRGGSK